MLLENCLPARFLPKVGKEATHEVIYSYIRCIVTMIERRVFKQDLKHEEAKKHCIMSTWLTLLKTSKVKHKWTSFPYRRRQKLTELEIDWPDWDFDDLTAINILDWQPLLFIPVPCIPHKSSFSHTRSHLSLERVLNKLLPRRQFRVFHPLISVGFATREALMLYKYQTGF